MPTLVAPAPQAAPPRLEHAPFKVLIVEDDRLSARILSSILRPEGYELTDVSSGEAALELYPIFLPDLVLLDVMMPGINGYQTCRALKAAYGEDCAPIIFITAKSESDDIVEGLEAGGVDYVPKPFRPREAAARIRVHLHNRQLDLQHKRLVDQLNKSNQAKNRLLGMAAHDLRNPLASIRGLADFLRDGTVGPLAPEQSELVDSIHSASQAMLDLVNELLDTSVIEAGELRIRLQPSSLVELIEESVCMNEINAGKKGTRIVLELADGPDLLTMDAAKIRQVVDNLLSNAIKFSPAGSTVTIRTTQAPGRAVVAVQDQGLGIPAGEADKLFKDFSRTSVRPTAGEPSTGLGLAICRKIIEAHAGRITAQNQPGGGCIFQFELPAPR